MAGIDAALSNFYHKLIGLKEFSPTESIPANGIANLIFPEGLGDIRYMQHRGAFDAVLNKASTNYGRLGIKCYSVDINTDSPP